jgi:hypothetical protein
MESARIPSNCQHQFWRLNSLPLSVGDDFSGSHPYQIVLTIQVDPGLVQGGDVMSLGCHLYRKDAQEFRGHVNPDPLLLGGQKMGDSLQMPNYKVKRVNQVPVDSGSRKAVPSGELAYRRKWIIRKSR